jgi:hypothetical protein
MQKCLNNYFPNFTHFQELYMQTLQRTLTTFMLIGLVFSFMACSEDDNPTTPTNKIKSIYPLHPQNSWTYRNNFNNQITTTTFKAANVNGKPGYYPTEAKDEPYAGYFQEREDGIWGVIPEEEAILGYKYPAEVGDSWESGYEEQLSLYAKDVKITVEAGAFTCYVYQSSVDSELIFLSEGIGVVAIQSENQFGTNTFISELVDYTVVGSYADTDTPSLSSSIFPLEVGNARTYYYFEDDFRDTELIEFQEQNGSRWYFENSTPILFQERQDGIWGKPVGAHQAELLFKYPVEIDESYSFFGETVTVPSIDTEITTPAGTFSCIAYEFNGSIGYFAKGIGLVARQKKEDFGTTQYTSVLEAYILR